MKNCLWQFVFKEQRPMRELQQSLTQWYSICGSGPNVTVQPKITSLFFRLVEGLVCSVVQNTNDKLSIGYLWHQLASFNCLSCALKESSSGLCVGWGQSAKGWRSLLVNKRWQSTWTLRNLHLIPRLNNSGIICYASVLISLVTALV